MSRISLSNISFVFPDGTSLFTDISVTFNNGVTGLTGSNGSGKSTLAKIAAGIITPRSGSVARPEKVKYLEQEFFESTGDTIASLLGVEAKYSAWLRINDGKGDISDFTVLDDDWELDSRIRKALDRIGLEGLTGATPVSRLSGGETIRARLATLFLFDHDFVILDEPTNHLDRNGRNAVFSFIEEFPRNKGMIIISHDRELLRKVDRIVEISPVGVKLFGGNYDLYKEISDAERDAATKTLEERKRKLEYDISKAESVINDQVSKSRSAGKANRDSGIPTIMLGLMKGSGEKTTQRKIEAHRAKIERAQEGIAEAEKKMIKEKKVTFDLLNSGSRSSIVFACTGLNILFGDARLWRRPLELTVARGERLRITGSNGSGKSSLCRVISGEDVTTDGELHIRPGNPVYLDQKLSFLDRSKTILENASRERKGAFDITEIRIRLGRLGFYGDDCFKLTASLSGGELIRAAVGVIVSLNEPPDLLILDEPTNNLDLKGIEMLQNAIGGYPGTVIIITHDDDFATGCGITRTVDLDDLYE
ncbi:MAG: ABC transporter ATP-binding protein [Ignavibacteriaceae bacterium]|nr:MAG: ABC transporter ATP-binding protein [Chlorobiota bacterium]GJQ31978.1 MAG: ABC transporter ATP-binding protein [Ignavibacteriaceae bacterium]